MLALLTALVALALGACAEIRRGGELPVEATASRVDVFLRAAPTEAGTLTMELDDVWLVDESGGRRLLQLARSRVDSKEAVRRLSLAGGIVPTGTYEAVVLRVRGAALDADGERRELRLAPTLPDDAEPPPKPPPEPPPETPADLVPAEDVEDIVAPPEPDAPATMEYVIPVRVEVRQQDAVSIFLEWNVAASILPGDRFRPFFAVGLERPQVRLGLLYVSDRATGSVLALDRTTGEVVATGKAGAAPSALAIARNRVDLYAANEGDGSITLLDTRRNLVEFVIPIRLSARTSDVVVADEGRMLAASNPGTDTVSLFDLMNVSRLGDVRVGRTPVRLDAAPRHRRIYVVNALSNSLSVIDINAREVIATLGLEADPTYVTVDRLEREFFVGHRTSPNVLVYDAESLGLLNTVFVGGNVTAMLADRRLDRVYVARERPNEIAVIDRRLGAVMRRIPISGRVTGLAQPVDGSLIYGAAPERGGLIVIDVTVGKELPLLPVGKAPTDVVVVD
ncbi:MAG: YncE family protein [Planctomycetota bacterium]